MLAQFAQKFFRCKSNVFDDLPQEKRGDIAAAREMEQSCHVRRRADIVYASRVGELRQIPSSLKRERSRAASALAAEPLLNQNRFGSDEFRF